MAKRAGSSDRWMSEHLSDEYVEKAKREGYRSRAVYKLIEINEKDRIIKPTMRVVDLGAAPGGWSQYASQIVGTKGVVYALDILPMDSFSNVHFIQGDFREQDVLDEFIALVGEDKTDLVICDMAPNMSGQEAVDQPRAMYLAELALEMCAISLKPGGDFCIKLFQGAEFEAYMKLLRQQFTKVQIRKPKASRPRSREVYALARGFKA